MKTIDIESLMLECILIFCENAAELGCPKEKSVDIWIRELPRKKALKVIEKLLDITERDSKRYKKSLK